MQTRIPTVMTDGGPWAEHDQACAVSSVSEHFPLFEWPEPKRKVA